MLNGTMTCVYETWDNWCAGHKGKRTYTLFLSSFSEFACFKCFFCLFYLSLYWKTELVLGGGWGGLEVRGIIRERNASDERCTLLLPILFTSCFTFCSCLGACSVYGELRIPDTSCSGVAVHRFCGTLFVYLFCVVLLNVLFAVPRDLFS